MEYWVLKVEDILFAVVFSLAQRTMFKMFE
jgi:hypothetical protein